MTSAYWCSAPPTDLTSWSVQSQTWSLLSRFFFINPETNKINAVSYAYGFFVLECIPIVTQLLALARELKVEWKLVTQTTCKVP